MHEEAVFGDNLFIIPDADVQAHNFESNNARLTDEGVMAAHGLAINLRPNIDGISNDQSDEGSEPKERYNLLEMNEHLKLRVQKLAAELATERAVRIKLQAEQDKSMTDELTTLPNRAWFMGTLKGLLENHPYEEDAENPTVPVLFFADLDGFKQVNDTKGHKTGDKVLEIVGPAMASSLREGDYATRKGGDEFVGVVYIPRERMGEIEDIKPKIRNRINTTVIEAVAKADLGRDSGSAVNISGVSVGFCTLEKGMDVMAALDAADKDMYKDKRGETKAESARKRTVGKIALLGNRVKRRFSNKEN